MCHEANMIRYQSCFRQVTTSLFLRLSMVQLCRVSWVWFVLVRLTVEMLIAAVQFVEGLAVEFLVVS